MNWKLNVKTFGAIGLMASLVALFGTVPLQIAQAQVETGVPAEIDDEACIASGMHSFYILQNIDLSPAQLEKIHMIQYERSGELEVLMSTFPGESDPSNFQYILKPGVEPPAEVIDAMSAALSVTLTKESAPEVIAALNEEFAQYAEFGIGTTVRFTEAQKAEMEQFDAGTEAQSLAVLTPEQQQQYQENLATQSRIYEACGMIRVDDVEAFETTGFSNSFEPSFY
jgi:Spy/CpxP family protein refolding chaperone